MSRSFFIALRRFCLWCATILVVGGNIINYFYCHLVLHDLDIEWKVAMVTIASALFFYSLYIWCDKTIQQQKLSILITGWTSMYLFFNMVGVILGYHLHTRAFMLMLFLIVSVGGVHLLIKICQSYFSQKP